MAPAMRPVRTSQLSLGITSPRGTEPNGRERFAWWGQLSRDASVPTILPASSPDIGEQVGQHVSRVAMM
jgi:hypothetical protein